MIKVGLNLFKHLAFLIVTEGLFEKSSVNSSLLKYFEGELLLKEKNDYVVIVLFTIMSLL